MGRIGQNVRAELLGEAKSPSPSQRSHSFSENVEISVITENAPAPTAGYLIGEQKRA